MCNWKWAGAAFGLPGLVGGAIADHADKKRKEAMARSQQIQQDLQKKLDEAKSVPEEEQVAKSVTRVLDSTAKKRTIKSLRIPMNTGTGSTGLNIGG